MTVTPSPEVSEPSTSHGPDTPAVVTRRFLTTPYLLGYLVLLALCVRLPFLMHSLDEVDSSNFARSLLHFDIRVHAPHPAGQFYYVMIGQALQFFIHDSLTTLPFESALFSSLALVPFFFIVRGIFRNDRLALLTVALTAFSYGYWLIGLRPISDPVSVFFILSTLCALYFGLDSPRWFCVAMALFGFTLGIKQLSVYFLAPTVLIINLIALLKHGWKITLVGALLFAVLTLGWLLPTVADIGSIRDPASWKWLMTASRAQQQFSYDKESLGTHLSMHRAEIHALHDFILPWGSRAFACVMLTLAVIGLWPTWRAGLRGKLFLIFGVPSILYYFLILYIFSKYYIYFIPVYSVLVVAALHWLCRSRPHQRFRAESATAAAVALLILVNFILTVPLLGRMKHFRSPSTLAYEYLIHRYGDSLKNVNVITDDGLVSVCLAYYHQTSGLNFADISLDARAALPLLTPAKPLYLLTSSKQDNEPPYDHLVDGLIWEKPLRNLLQCAPAQVSVYLYELNGSLPSSYKLGADGLFEPEVMSQDFYRDGWLGADVQLLLPRDNTPAAFVELDGVAPELPGLHYPLSVAYEISGGAPTQFTVRSPGEFTEILPLPEPTIGTCTDLHLKPAETVMLNEEAQKSADTRHVSLSFSRIVCSSPHLHFAAHSTDGWYLPETGGGKTWQWCDGEGKYVVASAFDGTLRLAGELMTALPRNRANIFLDNRQVASVDAPNEGETAAQSIDIPLTRGVHTLSIRGVLPGVKPNAKDGRLLSVGVRDFSVSFR